MFLNRNERSSVLGDVTPCNSLKVNCHFRGIGSSCSLLHAGLLLGLFVDPEDGDDVFLQNIGFFQQITLCYIPEDRYVHNQDCENLR
jgi:hypothetical protein